MDTITSSPNKTVSSTPKVEYTTEQLAKFVNNAAEQWILLAISLKDFDADPKWRQMGSALTGLSPFTVAQTVSVRDRIAAHKQQFIRALFALNAELKHLTTYMSGHDIAQALQLSAMSALGQQRENRYCLHLLHDISKPLTSSTTWGIKELYWFLNKADFSHKSIIELGNCFSTYHEKRICRVTIGEALKSLSSRIQKSRWYNNFIK